MFCMLPASSPPRSVAAWANAISEQINEDGKNKIVESGASEIVALTADELVAWQEAMRPVWDQFEDSIGAELIEAALAARQ